MTIADYLVLAVTAVAALTDARHGKVYNWLVYPAAALGVSIGFWSAAPLGNLVGLGASLALYFPLYRWSIIGGGDFKLLAALGAIKGFAFVLFGSFYILCAGSAMGLLVLAWRGRLAPSLRMVGGAILRPSRIVDATTQGSDALTTLPFAPAVLAGTVYSVYLESALGPFSLVWWN